MTPTPGNLTHLKCRFTTSPNSLVSSLIRFTCWSKISHIEFEVDPGYFPNYPDGGYLGAHWPDGVKIRPFDYDKGCVEIKGYIVCSEEVKKRVLETAYMQLGKPYDTTAILGMLFRRDWRETDSWFCSELFEYCMETANFPLIRDDKRYNRVTPQDLYESTKIILCQGRR